MRKEFLSFSAPLIEKEEIDEVVDTLKSGWLSTGKKVIKFEEMFREYKNCKHAIAVSSCTAGLHLSLVVLNIKEGDEVIVPTFTFCATAEVVCYVGAKPVFVDCDKKTMNIDPEDIKRKITKKTKAIIPVHFAGRPCNMDEIMDIAEKYNLKVIEDCAHAVETEYHGKKAGTFGELGCFSFYANKNVSTGEGGMVITNNDEYAEKLRLLRLHGMSKDAWKRFGEEGYVHYQILTMGYKYNMTDIQAAIGIHQLLKVERNWAKRKNILNKYNEGLKDLPLFLPEKDEANTRNAYHLYTILLDIDKLKITRDEFLNEMHKHNIGVGVHYIPLHLQPFYQNNFGYKYGDFPNAEWIGERTVSLPLSPKLTEDDVEDVISAVRDISIKNLK